MSEDNAACAHSRVTRDTIKRDDGARSDRWSCEGCGTSFEPSSDRRRWLLRRDILTEFEQAILKSDLVVGDNKRARLNSMKARVLGERP